MVMTRRQWLEAGALAALGWAGAAGHPARAAEVAGRVAAMSGGAVAGPRNDQRNLAVPEPVFLDEWVRTLAGSRLTLALGQSTTVRLGQETRFRVERSVVAAGGELVLDSGAVLYDHPAGTPGGRATMRSPHALIAVRGTRFFAGLLPDGFGVLVQDGEVAVSAAGRSVRLLPGEGTTIPRRGAAPGPVRQWPAEKVARAMAMVR